jgi:hypothetical protein
MQADATYAPKKRAPYKKRDVTTVLNLKLTHYQKLPASGYGLQRGNELLTVYLWPGEPIYLKYQ